MIGAMTDAQLAVMGSLAGVIFGVVGTLLTTFVQQRAENRRTSQRASEDRRKEHAQLVAEFSAAEMRSWKLAKIVHHWWRAHNSGSIDAFAPPKQAKMEELLNTEAALMDDLNERYALIRILVPSLADAASDLVDTRHSLDGGEGDLVALLAARSAARDKFEKEARSVLNS
jgi:hypothetical protein